MLLKIVSPTGKYKDASTYDDVLGYVLNPNKVKTGHQLHFNVSIHHPAEDMRCLAEKFKKTKGTKVRHMVLSFHPKKEVYITHQKALDIAGSVCDYYADEYQLVAAVHRDGGCVHVHIIMNTVNMETGRKYAGKKKEWHEFLRHIKEVIRPYGLRLQLEYEPS